jgi:hypothetical protein
MTKDMIMTGRDKEIFDDIIEFVPILMVDNLIGSQFSPKMFFHDKSMLIDSFPVDIDNTISLGSNGSFSIGSFLPKQGISMTIQPEIVFVAVSPNLCLFPTSSDCTVHDLPSLDINMSRINDNIKRDDGENGENSVKPNSKDMAIPSLAQKWEGVETTGVPARAPHPKGMI